MGDRLRRAFRKQGRLPHREPPAELQQPAFDQNVAMRRLAQEIDVEVHRHRVQRLRAEMGENRDPDPDVGQSEHGGAGDRAAGTQVTLMGDQPQPRVHRPDLLDHDGAAAMVELRKNVFEQLLDFGDGQDGTWTRRLSTWSELDWKTPTGIARRDAPNIAQNALLRHPRRAAGGGECSFSHDYGVFSGDYTNFRTCAADVHPARAKLV